MQNLNNKIERIDLKIRQVLQKLETLKTENQVLLEENIKLKEEQNLYLEKLKEVDEEIAMQHANSDRKYNKSVDVDIVEIKEELKQYIEEIDSCIDSLKAK